MNKELLPRGAFVLAVCLGLSCQTYASRRDSDPVEITEGALEERDEKGEYKIKDNVRTIYDSFKQAWEKKQLPTPLLVSDTGSVESLPSATHLVDGQHIIVKKNDNAAFTFDVPKGKRCVSSAYVVDRRMVDQHDKYMSKNNAVGFCIGDVVTDRDLQVLFNHIILVFAKAGAKVAYYQEKHYTKKFGCQYRLLVKIQSQQIVDSDKQKCLQSEEFGREFDNLRVIRQIDNKEPTYHSWRDASLNIVCINQGGDLAILTAYPEVYG